MTRERRPPVDRLSPERTDRDFHAILLLVVEIHELWGDAVDGGVWPPRSGFNGPGSGLAQQRPTEAAVISPTRRQLRGSVKHAARLIANARADLEEAGHVLTNGVLRSDPQEWIKATEKRAAAEQVP